MAALLCSGSIGAWGEETEITATLVHTAGTQWGLNKGANTVDSEKEKINVDQGGSRVYGGAAYAEFSFSLPDGCTVVSAELTFSINQGGKNATRNNQLYFMNSGFTLDYDALKTASGDQRNSASRTIIEGTVDNYGAGDHLNLKKDVTDAVRTIQQASQNYIIFQITGNAGSADLYGKGAAEDKRPILKITYTTDVVYSFSFEETAGLKPQVVVYSDEAKTQVADASSLKPGTYYYTATLAGYEDYAGSFEVTSSNETVNFTMKAKPRFTFTVNAVDQKGEVLETLITDEDAYQGKTFSCTYPKYRTDANGKVTHKCDVSEYYASYTPAAAGTENIAYTEYTGTAYFQEAEGIGTWNGWKDDGRLSGGKSVRSPQSSPATLIVVKEDGVYDITFVTFSINVNSGGTTKVYKNGTEEIHSYVLDWSINYATTAGKGLQTIQNVALKAGDVINVVTGNTNHAFDYTLIEKITAIAVPVSSVGYATFVPSTNVVVPDGVTVYTGKVNDGKTSLALNPVTTGTVLGAGQGFIVKADAGSYNFAVTTEEAAKLDNDLKAADAPINVSAESNIYVLAKPKSSPVGFYRVNANTTVAAGKAYIELAAAKNAAPVLTFDDATTGISEVKTAGVNTTATDFYTLQGVKVNKNTRGLLLHNGKKYLVK